MKSFFKQFLRDAPTGEAPQICLGAFGKHPGWNDHMDDIGLETESLVAAKRLLYRQGIGAQLDAGAWEKLAEDARLPVFHHEFVWSRELQVLAGRMWPSTDGKGRALYPMIVCAHGCGVSAEAAITRLLPQLETIEARCRATRSSEAVRVIVKEGREHCGTALADSPSADVGRPGVELPGEFVKGPLAAILLEARGSLAAYLRGRFRPRSEPGAVGVRVPSLEAYAIDDLIFWHRFFAAILDPEVPLLLMKPVGLPWLDAVVGEPTPGEFFALRAAPPAVEILGESGGEVDEATQQEAGRLWDTILDPTSVVAPQGPVWLKKIFG